MTPIFETRYKRGILSTHVEVFEDRIRITRGRKDVREARIDRVKSVHHYEAPSRYDVYHCFWIDAGETRLYLQGSERTSSMLGEMPFQRSLAAILDLLAEKRPDVTFSQRAGVGVEWTYFLLGILGGVPCVLLGGVLVFEAPLVGLPIVLISLPLVFFGYAFRPWRRRVGVPVSALRDQFRIELEADGVHLQGESDPAACR